MTELNPCKDCGSPAIIQQGAMSFDWGVWCSECVKKEGKNIVSVVSAYKEFAIKYWNMKNPIRDKATI